MPREPVIPSKYPGYTSPFPEADYFEGNPEGFGVYEWSPAPPGTVGDVPVTQVHLHGISSLGRVVWRFKGTGTLDSLIDALIKHREGVFGPRERVMGSTADTDCCPPSSNRK